MPTEETRKHKMLEGLDPDFYAAVRVRYRTPLDLQGVPLRVLTI